MRAVVQRVTSASVTVGGEVVGAIGAGLMVFVGVGPADDPAAAAWLAGKVARLRIFPDHEGRMNRSVVDVRGDVLVVSQFTLLADTASGNRPAFTGAASPEVAEPLVEAVAVGLEALLQRPVARGRFRADMQVALVNDGPVTILLDGPRK